MKRTMLRVTFALLVATSVHAAAPLTVDYISQGEALYGYSPRSVRWSPDGQHVFFEWKERTRPVEADYDTWVVDANGANLRKLSDDEKKDAPPVSGTWTRDHRRAVYIDDGDVVLYDGAKHRNLTDTTAEESSPRLTYDEKHVAFVRGNNLFVLSLEDGSLVQMTNIVTSDEKGTYVDLFEDKDKKKSASQKWVEGEERALIETVDRRAKKKEADEAREKKEHPRKPYKLEAKQTVADLELTPDGKYVIASLRTEAEKGKKTIVPNYVTLSAYTESIPGREKVGDDFPVTRLVRLDAVTGEPVKIELGVDRKPQAAADAKKTDTAAKKAEASSATGETKGEAAAGDSRPIGIERLMWSEDGKNAVLIVRAQDNKDRWFLALDASTGKTRVITSLHDDAWVNNFRSDSAGWLRDNATLWFIADTSGWAQLYSVPFAGGKPKALTDGKWEVVEASLSNDGTTFDLTTSESSLYEHQLYRMSSNGGPRTRVTSEAAMHDATSSPDLKMIADVVSFANRPPELYLRVPRSSSGYLGVPRSGSDGGAPPRNSEEPRNSEVLEGVRVTTSPDPEFASRGWIDPPIVEIPARDGAKVPARMYKPANFASGGPAVIFVHGAGYLQNVHRGWSSYAHEYLFHHLLMERGFMVLDLDYRGSAGYGRAWRTAIYEHMGGKDLDDQVDAAKWLASQHGVDPKKIGIYGGSYGGFITLMAMFTTPGMFAAGAALRPVTDWAHYNAPYTSNILNDPQMDPEAYRRSSPIYHAKGLAGALLICHGVVDTNVHFQDTVRLAQKLIELRKENWEVAMFPMENHGFVESASWADEYKRILKLFETNLH